MESQSNVDHIRKAMMSAITKIPDGHLRENNPITLEWTPNGVMVTFPPVGLEVESR